MMTVTELYRTVVEETINDSKKDFKKARTSMDVLQQLQHLWQSKLMSSGVLSVGSSALNTESIKAKYDASSYTPVTNTPTYDISVNDIPTTNNNHTIPTPPVQISSVTNPTNFLYTDYLTMHGYSSGGGAPSEHLPPPLSTPFSPVTPNNKNQSVGLMLDGRPQPFMAPIGTTVDDTSVGVSPRVERSTKRVRRVSSRNVTSTTTITINDSANNNNETMNGNITNVPQVDGTEDDKEELDSDLDDEEQDPITDNLILCQFEKITRIKNKRKCTLKDGIMHINGRDFVFSKANGECEF